MTDIRFFLPKESATFYVPPVISKTISIQIEDFLERLEQSVPRQLGEGLEVFKLPTFLIGDHKVFVECWNDSLDLYVMVKACDGSNVLVCTSVTGNCGNLAIKNTGTCCDGLSLLDTKIGGSLEELKGAMTSSGNHQLDLRVYVAVNVAVNGNYDEDDQWIIPR